MPKELWWVWMALAAALAIGEIFTAGFFLMWFSIGAVAAGILALLGFGQGWQLLCFTVLSTVLFALSRKFADRLTGDQPAGIGADRLIGKRGIVLEEVDNLRNTGRVRVEQEEWRAHSATGEAIPAGVPVQVVRVEGTRVVVLAIAEEV